MALIRIGQTSASHGSEAHTGDMPAEDLDLADVVVEEQRRDRSTEDRKGMRPWSPPVPAGIGTNAPLTRARQRNAV